MAGGEDRFDLEAAGLELLAVGEDRPRPLRRARRRPPAWATSGGLPSCSRASARPATWSPWGWVTRTWVISIPSRSARSSSGPRSSLPSISTPVLPLGVGDQVGVRQPLRVLGPLDDQRCSFGSLVGRTLPELRRVRGDGAALEQRAGDQLGVVPGRRVADAGEDEEAGAGGAAVRLAAGRPGGRARTRRSSPARPPGSRRGRRRGCASPGWRRRSPRRRASRGRARGRRRAGSAPGGRRRSTRRRRARLRERRASGDERARRRRPEHAGAAAGAARRAARDQRPAGERVVTEAAQPERPISSATQPPSELPATCGRSTPLREALLVHAPRARLAAVGSTSAGSGGVVAEARHVDRDAPRARPRAGRSPAPRRCGAAEPVDQQQRLARRPRRAHRQPGLAKSACTSPIRRSRKPASEELR